MEKYSKYKDSGVKWIGDIPKHWGIVELKRLTKFNPQRREELDKETLVGYAPMDKVRSDMLTPLSIQIKNLSTGLTYFEEGDVVMAKVTPCFENGNVAIVPKMVHYCGYGSSELFVYRCNEEKLKSRLLLYYMLSAGFVSAGVSSMTGTGGLRRVSPTFARNVRIPLPPLAEQRAIVSYLDGKVGQIDTYVAKQTQQIELLKELKQAVIANAVTKGIDKKTKLKQTGISWIGSVPQHWERCRCKDVLTETKLLVGNGKHTLLSLTTNGVIVRDLSEGKGKFPKDFNTYKVVKPNDLVFCLFDVDETPRTVGLVHNHGMLTGAYNVFEAINVDTSFLYHYFIALDNRKALKSLYKGLRKVIPLPAFMSMPLYLPPLSEQRAIVSYIEAQTANINKLIDAYQQQVERVKEYKQRLISDAVTGKMNVTGKQTQTN